MSTQRPARTDRGVRATAPPPSPAPLPAVSRAAIRCAVKHAPPGRATTACPARGDRLTRDRPSAQVPSAMADLDPELLERAVRWCAEAGRHVGAAQVRRALAPLGWDELLAVRA